MKIILVGVPCVGKSTVGKMLAERLGYKFFDFDFEIEKYFNSAIEIIKEEFWTGHSFRKEARKVLRKILKENDDNFVIAMPPSGLMDFYWRIIKEDDSIITIVLKDKAKNIVKRLTFYDRYSKQIEVEMTAKKEAYYLKELRLDIEYFRKSHNRAKIREKVDGKSALQVADDLALLLTSGAKSYELSSS
ncbi:MAG: shikimate kinase [Clostridia bacterium]|nr:shikimate kinase [Clostridia bacterium]MDD4048827.1 shikimate kinase [Clostridia bacterium]